MKPLRRGWHRLLGMFMGNRQESELSDEIAAHLEMQIEDNLRAGMPPHEAERAARLKFGSVDSAKESYRDQRGLPWIEGLLSDFRYGARGLRKTPGFTIVAVLTLALGIGSITAVFSLVDQVLLRPPGIRNPERVFSFHTSYGKLNLDVPVVSARLLADLHQNPATFDRAALMAEVDVNYTGADEPQRLRSAVVTSEWFDVFGVKPLIGRAFRNDEDQPNTNRVVILSHAAWKQWFGGEPSALGRAIELNRVAYRVIGVMPPDFRWPRDADLWIPAGLSAEAFLERARFGTENQMAVARSQPGIELNGVQQWSHLHTDHIRHSEGETGMIATNYQWSISAVGFAETFVGETKKPLLILLGAVIFVLLIVCLNIAGLLVARASVRAQELAVRSALGATRGQLMRSLWAESFLLSLAGGAAGLAVASVGIDLLLMLAPQDVAAGLKPNMDPRILLFCGLIALNCTILCGMAPAWLISRSDPSGRLKVDDRVSAGGPARQKMRSGLVIAESALAIMLLVAAGLFLRSFTNLRFVDPGLEPQGVMTAVFWLPEKAYPTPAEQTGFYRAVLDRLEGTPGVVVAALGNPIPFSGSENSGVFEIVDRARAAGEPLAHADQLLVTPHYFQTLGIPIRAGRIFNDGDRVSSERVALIDENAARQYWPGEDPVGKGIIKDEQTYRIVGIAGHVKHSDLASSSGRGALYFSMLQIPTPAAWILAKTDGNVGTMAAAIREAVRSADPRQAVYSFISMDDLVANSLAPRRFGMRLVGFFAAVALFMAALGLYGVISYSVIQRRREIGIRVALGAGHQGIVRLVLGGGLRLAAIGSGLGILGSLLGMRLIRSQLFEVSPFDPVTIGVMALILLSSALLASYLPARRAMRADPMAALRPE